MFYLLPMPEKAKPKAAPPSAPAWWETGRTPPALIPQHWDLFHMISWNRLAMVNIRKYLNKKCVWEKTNSQTEKKNDDFLMDFIVLFLYFKCLPWYYWITTKQKESWNWCGNSLHDDEFKQILEQKMVKRPIFFVQKSK